MNARQDEPVLHVKEERIKKRRAPPRDSLAGTFRVGTEEFLMICFLREKKHMSINHIADLLGRSSKTICDIVNPINKGHRRSVKIQLPDNRKFPPQVRTKGKLGYLQNKKHLIIKTEMFFAGLYNSPREALEDKMIPARILKNYIMVSKNSPILSMNE